MGLFDSIDNLLEPVTKKIFATKIAKNIELMNGEDLFTSHKYIYSDSSYSYVPGNTYHNDSCDD
ncbi:MAG: hypothetical protein J0665_10110 [Deltaproteobacteria bacterium]|nr:hypothetical protein [Deltaproteobacteria bacterium]